MESGVTISPAKEVFYCLFISEPCPLFPCILSRYTHTLDTMKSSTGRLFSLQTNNSPRIDCSNGNCCGVKYGHSSFGKIFMAVILCQYYLCAALKSKVLQLTSCCDFFFFFCILTIIQRAYKEIKGSILRGTFAFNLTLPYKLLSCMCRPPSGSWD